MSSYFTINLRDSSKANLAHDTSNKALPNLPLRSRSFRCYQSPDAQNYRQYSEWLPSHGLYVLLLERTVNVFGTISIICTLWLELFQQEIDFEALSYKIQTSS
jgi:hypothetical protein